MKQLHANMLLALGTSLALTFFAAAPATAHREVTASQAAGGDVRWALPGPRRLDPEIFGTPAQPRGFEPDIGVPIEARMVSADGSAFTTTAGPTPFSDNYKPITGSFQSLLIDRTPVDTPASQDSVEAEYSFTDPSGNNQYRLVVKRLIPVGPVHRFFGGVLIGGTTHGSSSFGTRLVPTLYTYASLWGVGELSINGEVVADDRLVHVMSTERIRSADSDGFRLLTDGELTHTGVQTHVVLPNTVITPQGPKTAPVPSGFILPNGVEQPFIHVMYEETEVSGIDLL